MDGAALEPVAMYRQPATEALAGKRRVVSGLPGGIVHRTVGGDVGKDIRAHGKEGAFPFDSLEKA